jgi:hypothetical protein
MDQNLIPYRSLLTAKERLSFNVAFSFAMGFFALATVMFLVGIFSLAGSNGNLYAYSPFLISGVLLIVACSYSAKKDRLEKDFYSRLKERFSERLLMDHGLVPAISLPPLGLPLNFSDLKNESVKAIIYLTKTGDLELHRLQSATK